MVLRGARAHHEHGYSPRVVVTTTRRARPTPVLSFWWAHRRARAAPLLAAEPRGPAMSGTAAPTSASFADRARDVVARLSREDKLRAVSGSDFWHTELILTFSAWTLGHGRRRAARAAPSRAIRRTTSGSARRRPPPASRPRRPWGPRGTPIWLGAVGGAIGRGGTAPGVSVVLGPG